MAELNAERVIDKAQAMAGLSTVSRLPER